MFPFAYAEACAPSRDGAAWIFFEQAPNPKDRKGVFLLTAGRAAFIGGSVPVRSGMTKVGLPGAVQGWQTSDVTMATVLKGQGYATGQFGKNHQGDLDEHLPTMHGFDEFLGNLYQLSAEEEPET